MRRARRAWTHVGIIGAVCLAATGAAPRAAAAPAPGVDAAFRKFWSARTPQEAQAAAAEVVASGVSFDEALRRLERGRPYSSSVPRGTVRLSRQSGGTVYYYDLDVPRSYDPERRYQVRVQLHGGVNGQVTNGPRGDGEVGALAGAEQIYVLPYAGSATPWWTNAQLENLRAILDSVKRTYNVDENRVALAGVSDGATATWYVAMRDATPFSSFISLNGFFMVLGNPATGAEGDLLPNNWLNKPFFVVNGGADPLYPTRIVDPYVERLEAAGVALEYWPQAAAGHTTRWWPEMKDTVESFVHRHPRVPLPDTLTWESAGDPLTNRAHWLVIDRIAVEPGLAPLPDVNETLANDDDQPPSPRLLAHLEPFGRVDVTRKSNVVTAIARGVAEFTLLISPEAFDLAQPVRVVCNGRVVFDARVQPSVETLMKWAARDNDRTMLFGGEVHVKPMEQP